MSTTLSNYFSCQLCYGETFKWQSDLYKHCATKHFYDELTAELNMGPQAPYRCPKCPYTTDGPRQLLIHYGLSHRAVVRMLETRTNQQHRVRWHGSFNSNMLPMPASYR